MTSTRSINDLAQPSVNTRSGQIEHTSHPSMLARAVYRQPRNMFGVLAIVTRADAALVLATPVVSATVLAWWTSGRLDGLLLFFSLLGIVATALGLHALTEYYDRRRSASVPDVIRNANISGAQLIESGQIAAGTVRNIGVLLFVISLLCVLWMTLLAGWPMLLFSGISLLLALTSILPPFRYGYRGWGLGEAGLLIAFGLLPMLGGYYAQAQALSWAPFGMGLALGLLIVPMSMSYNLIYYHRDWSMRKRTLVVELGPQRGLDTSIAFVVVAFAAFIPVATVLGLPLTTLLVLAALPIPLRAIARVRHEHITTDDCLVYYSSIVSALLLTGLLFSLVLWVDRIF